MRHLATSPQQQRGSDAASADVKEDHSGVVGTQSEPTAAQSEPKGTSAGIEEGTSGGVQFEDEQWTLTLCMLSGRSEAVGPLSASWPVGEVRKLAAAVFETQAPKFQLCFETAVLDAGLDLQSLREVGLHDGATIVFLRRQICGPCGYWVREDGVEGRQLKGCRFCNFGWAKTDEETDRIYSICKRPPEVLPDDD